MAIAAGGLYWPLLRGNHHREGRPFDIVGLVDYQATGRVNGRRTCEGYRHELQHDSKYLLEPSHMGPLS